MWNERLVERDEIAARVFFQNVFQSRVMADLVAAEVGAGYSADVDRFPCSSAFRSSLQNQNPLPLVGLIERFEERKGTRPDDDAVEIDAENERIPDQEERDKPSHKFIPCLGRGS